MDKKHELTEKLKVLETELYDLKTDLKGIEGKLNIAYKYEDDLNIRQIAAKQKTEELRLNFFNKMTDITKKYNSMKNIFDIFTGNFYES